MKKKKNIPLIIAMVIGVAYALYSLWYWMAGGAAAQAGTDSAAQLGGAMAAAIVMPHVMVELIAAVFNVLGVVFGKPAFALTAGILYAVAMVLFPMYFMFVIVEMVLCFVAFAQMRKARRASSGQ